MDEMLQEDHERLRDLEAELDEEIEKLIGHRTSTNTTSSVRIDDNDNCTSKLRCRICQRQFSSNPLLRRHQRLHTSIRPYSCLICKKRFPWIEHLQAHKKTHRKCTFNCSHCAAQFSSTSALRRHERIHSSSYRYTCSVCLRGFHLSEPYKIHLRQHASMYPFECGICHKQFISRASCRRHTLSHSLIATIQCDQCERRFTNIQSANRHQQMHNGIKPFQCIICNLRLATKHNLRRHIMRIHPECQIHPENL